MKATAIHTLCRINNPNAIRMDNCKCNAENVAN